VEFVAKRGKPAHCKDCQRAASRAHYGTHQAYYVQKSAAYKKQRAATLAARRKAAQAAAEAAKRRPSTKLRGDISVQVVILRALERGWGGRCQ
jgi:hypothetical protein